MSAVTHNITIEQGATMRLLFRYETKDNLGVVTPVNLSTYTARMQIRKTLKADPPMLSLTTENGGITLGADGSIVVEATAEQTAALDAAVGVYDLELEAADGRVTRLLKGNVKVSFEVTR